VTAVTTSSGSFGPETAPEPAFDADERAMLDGWLDLHLATVARKCAGLSDDDAVRSLVPSATTVFGIVKHLVWVERGWFQRRLAGHELVDPPFSDADPDGEFRRAQGETLASVLAEYAEECDRSRAVSSAMALDDIGAIPRDGDHVTVRWVLSHMIEETARHNGHLDILREQLDGTTGEW
jgi:uncharacterized damage-inducible protein DinB